MCICKEELKYYCGSCHIQTKSFCKQNNNNNKNEPSLDHTDLDESDASQQESDDCARLDFDKVVPDYSTFNNTTITEQKRRSNDTIALDKEHERVVSNWIQHKPK